MLFKTVALLALATATMASPHQKRHRHHWHGTDVGTGDWSKPMGGMYLVNASNFAAQAVASSTVPVDVLTVTVSPVPASPAASTVAANDANTPQMSASTEAKSGSGTIYYVPPTSSVLPVDAASGASGACTSTSTTTVTSIDMYTVTVQPQQPSVAPSVASSVASGVASSAAAVAASPPAAKPSSSSSSSSASLSTASVSAGNFYQKPSMNAPSASSVSPAASSAPAPAAAYQPTTMATSAAAPPTPAPASSAPASSAPASSGASTGGKKGLSYNTASLTDAFAGKGMSWAYNWGPAPGGTLLAGVDFVPMNWGPKDFAGWSSVQKADYYLSFNEPDIGSQSNMSPADAAAAHIQYMNPLAGSAKIGSPGVTNGATTSPPMGIHWLSQFFAACAGKCHVDFVAYHWYNSAADIADFKQHTQDVINLAQQNGVSKVWCTEFGTVASSDADTASFLSQATAYLDATAAVERYAYFMAGVGAGQLLSSTTALSTVGQAYTS